MVKKLLFDWKYTVYGDRTPSAQKPLVLEGRDRFDADETTELFLVKEAMIAFIKKKCKQRVDNEFQQYDRIVEKDNVEIFNVREEND